MESLGVIAEIISSWMECSESEVLNASPWGLQICLFSVLNLLGLRGYTFFNKKYCNLWTTSIVDDLFLYCCCSGYLNNPEATENSIDADGWLHTGDVGFVDDDDEIFIVDRLKEIIKYKGLQVAPAELEALLITHPSIVDAAVVG